MFICFQLLNSVLNPVLWSVVCWTEGPLLGDPDNSLSQLVKYHLQDIIVFARNSTGNNQNLVCNVMK